MSIRKPTNKNKKIEEWEKGCEVGKTTKTFRVNPELWQRFKIYCAQKDIPLSEKLESLIEKEIN